MGLLGLPFPEELGGSGASVVTCCLSTEALGHAVFDQGHLLGWERTRICARIPYTNTGYPLSWRSTYRKACQRRVDRLHGALQSREPVSDAGSITTTAVKKGDKWILNGTKTFITNAPVCNVCVVYAHG